MIVGMLNPEIKKIKGGRFGDTVYLRNNYGFTLKVDFFYI